MTVAEYLNIPFAELWSTLGSKGILKMSIRFYEELVKDLSTQMEDLGRNKKEYLANCTADDYNWLKAEVREQLNGAKHCLKEQVLEMQYENQGFNPPYCYHH